jgi:hypothetical protein
MYFTTGRRKCQGVGRWALTRCARCGLSRPHGRSYDRKQDTRAGAHERKAPAVTMLKPGRTGRWCAPTERTLGEALPSTDSPPCKRDLVVARRGLAACLAETRIFGTLDCRSSREAPCAPCCGARASRARRRPLRWSAASKGASIASRYSYLPPSQKGFKIRPSQMHFAASGIVDLSARCKHVLHGNSGPTVR